MSIANKILNRFRKNALPEKAPAAAYDLWAHTYDEQPDNLMLQLDHALFGVLIADVPLHNTTIADIGCGTGRHWAGILDKKPQRLTGYDVSAGMLQVLKQKYPEAEVYQPEGNRLPQLEDTSCDLLISTLALAHIPDMEEALAEWKRVLRKGGDIILTDYHPEAFAKGADRTFRYQGQTIAIQNHIHTLDKLRQTAAGLGLDIVRFYERKIDTSVRHYYERQAALHVYERFENVPIIYGMHLKKRHVAA